MQILVTDKLGQMDTERKNMLQYAPTKMQELNM